MSNVFVAILMGSDSDWPVMQNTHTVLKDLGLRVEVKVTSAHRTPEATHNYVKDAESRGCQVFICAAGLAAHLAGAVAGLTTRPVIGVPMDGGAGVPVATVAIGKAGAKNAGYLAAQMLGVADPEVAQRVAADRKANAEAVIAKDAELQKTLNN